MSAPSSNGLIPPPQPVSYRGDFALFVHPSAQAAPAASAEIPIEEDEKIESAPPPIVNSQAAALAQLPLTPKNVFCILRKKIQKGFPTEIIPAWLSEEKPRLADYAIKEFSQILPGLKDYADKNPSEALYLPQVKEALHLLCQHTLYKRGFLTPGVLLYKIRASVLEGCEDMAHHLRDLFLIRRPFGPPEERLFPFLLTLSWQQIEHDLKKFSQFEVSYPAMPQILESEIKPLYLRALADSPLVPIAEGFENDNQIDEWIEETSLSHWQKLLEQIGFQFNTALNLEQLVQILNIMVRTELPADREPLEVRLKHLIATNGTLNALQRALSLLAPYPNCKTSQADQLLFLANEARRAEDFSLFSFPKCRQSLPALFNQLRSYSHINWDLLRKALTERIGLCQAKLRATAILPSEKERYLDEASLVIYRAASEFFFQTAKVSLLSKESWPGDLLANWNATAIKTGLNDEAFNNENCTRQHEQFLYLFWDLYAEQAPDETFKKIILALSDDHFAQIKAAAHDVTGHALAEKVQELADLSYDLAAMKTRCPR